MAEPCLPVAYALCLDTRCLCPMVPMPARCLDAQTPAVPNGPHAWCLRILHNDCPVDPSGLSTANIEETILHI